MKKFQSRISSLFAPVPVWVVRPAWALIGAWALISIIAICVPAARADAQAPASGAPAASANTLGPQELVEDSAKRMLTELDKNRSVYANDPAKLDSLVANVL